MENHSDLLQIQPNQGLLILIMIVLLIAIIFVAGKKFKKKKPEIENENSNTDINLNLNHIRSAGYELINAGKSLLFTLTLTFVSFIFNIFLIPLGAFKNFILLNLILFVLIILSLNYGFNSIKRAGEKLYFN